jgi:hypothetical protein
MIIMMKTLFRSTYVTIFLVMSILLYGCGSGDWHVLFDGETFDGWEASENKDSWLIEDGTLVTNGPRSHLFYTGEVLDHDFKNFEFVADVKTLPGSNSGIYIHTEYQDEGWPAKGYECQVINSRPDLPEGSFGEHKMTGSIYAISISWCGEKPFKPLLMIN